MDWLRNNFASGLLLNGRYDTISPLNHGSFGMVFLAKDLVTCEPVALKCLNKATTTTSHYQSCFAVDERSEELNIHTRIGSHRNIVNLLDSFETDTHTYLVLEYCPMGDLYEAIRHERGPKETEHVRDFMLQLVNAVESLHSQGIYHRDIKPENIFMTSRGVLKLGDFGLATTSAWSFESAVGSDRYMSPEQYEQSGNGLSPAKADIWSVGICLLNILFSRNPFAVPADSDPLFADFRLDRQSLFDMFPNMSQDTFEILNHCLVIDPNKRSLALVKDALRKAVSFTTDDESLDEFCTENREPVLATANREELRTPSVASPVPEYFSWSKALRMTPQPKSRQFSDLSEDLFPGSEPQDWGCKADAQSIESNVDSGLGISLASTDSSILRTKPVAIACSLPATGTRSGRALSSIFGKRRTQEPKSWSDMWDEEEEERELEAMAKMKPRKTLHSNNLSQDDTEDDGRSTPRAMLGELKAPSVNTRNNSPVRAKDDGISEQTGFIFEQHSPPASRYSPKRSIMDKWAALGERRRGATPARKEPVPETKPTRPNWRRNFMGSRPKQTDYSLWKQKEWNMSQDWRRSEHHLPRRAGGQPPVGQLDGFSDSDSDGDVEWVGGLASRPPLVV